MELAARLLTETQLSITEIALHMGYQNGSKFSAAFCDEMGVLPGEYRKKLGSFGVKTVCVAVSEWRTAGISDRLSKC